MLVSALQAVAEAVLPVVGAVCRTLVEIYLSEPLPESPLPEATSDEPKGVLSQAEARERFDELIVDLWERDRCGSP